MSEAVEAVIDRRDPAAEPRFGSDFRRSKDERSTCNDSVERVTQSEEEEAWWPIAHIDP